MEMDRRLFLKTSAATLLVGASALVYPSAFISAYADNGCDFEKVIVTCYSIHPQNIVVYSTPRIGLDEIRLEKNAPNYKGMIYPGDEITINTVNVQRSGNRAVHGSYCAKVTYPITKGGGTKTGYIIQDKIILCGQWCASDPGSPTKKVYTKKRIDGANYGWIEPGDTVQVIGSRNGYTQIMYKVSGRWKLAVISNSEASAAHLPKAPYISNCRG